MVSTRVLHWGEGWGDKGVIRQGTRFLLRSLEDIVPCEFGVAASQTWNL